MIVKVLNVLKKDDWLFRISVAIKNEDDETVESIMIYFRNISVSSDANLRFFTDEKRAATFVTDLIAGKIDLDQ